MPVTAAGTHRRFTLLEKGGLLFEKLGGMHVLRSAWNRNRYEGCSLYRSKAERELAAWLAGTKTIAWAR